MESHAIDADVIVLQARLPEDRAIRGLTYGTVSTQHDGLWRYFRIGRSRQWLLAREVPDTGSDREVMRAIRDELRTIGDT